MLSVAIVLQSVAVTINSRSVSVDLCAVIVLVITVFLALPKVVVISVTLATVARLVCAQFIKASLSYASRVASSVGAAKVMALRPKTVTRSAFAKYILMLK